MTRKTHSNTLHFAHNCYFLVLLGISMLYIPLQVSAGDISRDVRQGHEDTGNYFELGAAIAIFDDPPTIAGESQEETDAIPIINGRYEWRGLFVEAFTESYDEIIFGYELVNSKHWAIDMVASPLLIELGQDENEQLIGIENRDVSLLAGIRATGYFQQNILQFKVLHDISNTHHGWNASALAGRHWQVRNWNFHSIIGAHYSSEDINDYYFSIRPNEVSERFPSYTAEQGIVYTAEIGVTYPLSEKWVTRSTLAFLKLPDTVIDSPIFSTESNTNVPLFVLGISYVF